MKIDLLQGALSEFKRDIELAIRTAQFGGKTFSNGGEAKQALIRSQRLIMKVHEVVKISLKEKLDAAGVTHSIHPPIGASSPEIPITGFIKAKDQDIVILFDEASREIVADGPLKGTTDTVGIHASERAIVVGVRSQMSSVGKNFDTLMERAFAETLNLRLRLPSIVMGEVYVLPVVEYDDRAMSRNQVEWKSGPISVPKFVRTFLGISGRGPRDTNDLYKYERTALVLADFRETPPKLVESLSDLIGLRAVPPDFGQYFERLSPRGFARDLVLLHRDRHDVP